MWMMHALTNIEGLWENIILLRLLSEVELQMHFLFTIDNHPFWKWFLFLRQRGHNSEKEMSSI